MIKLFSPSIDQREINAAIKSLKSSNWASGAGLKNVHKFEHKFTQFTHAKDCVAVNSGTAALHLSLNILDILGKDVLVPSLTFVTTVHSILYNGGNPIFVDVDPTTLCIDVGDIERKITPKTKVIIPVHFGGIPSNMSNIQKIANKKSQVIVEDAAHACGSKFQNKLIGSISDLTCFSFHPVKNLAMPKGGAITINSKDKSNLKKRLQSLRWCGIDNRKDSSYDITSLGYNYYMDEISASIGIVQLAKLKKFNSKRLKIAKRYHNELKVSDKMPYNKDCCYHLYWIRVKNRKEFMKKMHAHKIETGIHYQPVHLMSYYKTKTNLPITEKITKEIVTLPMHTNLSETQVDFIIKKANYFLESNN